MPLNQLAEVEPLLKELEAAFPGVLTIEVQDDRVALCLPREHLFVVCRFLRDALDLDLLVAETAVDWVDWFDVVYILRSTAMHHDLAFTVQVDRDDPVVPSIAGVWAGANWLERETYDLMGIQFSGHPDPRRILTWDEFEGHPLRKDFGLGENGDRAYEQVPPGYKSVGEE